MKKKKLKIFLSVFLLAAAVFTGILSVFNLLHEFKREVFAYDRGLIVPDNYVLNVEHSFVHPEINQARDFFFSHHQLLEQIYNGDGSWGHGYSDWEGLLDWPDLDQITHPLIRATARPVRAYLLANQLEPNSLFLQRASEGLDWLLSKQQANGAFLWYRTNEGTDPNDRDNLYPTGEAGLALIQGYQIFQDQRYLSASEKAADWEANYPVDSSANYNFFAVRHLAFHYKITGKTQYLDAAVEKARHTIEGTNGANGYHQTDYGYWSDTHSQYIWYHNIILSGMIELYHVLPSDHTFREQLKKALIKAINHDIVEQTISGAVYEHPSNSQEWRGKQFIFDALIEAKRIFPTNNLEAQIRGLALYNLAIPPGSIEPWKAEGEWILILRVEKLIG